jgi:arginine utilization regulatory protein
MIKESKHDLSCHFIDSENLFRSIVNCMDEWLYIIDQDFKIVYVNQVALKLVFCGVNPIGRSIFDTFSGLTPESSIAVKSFKNDIFYSNIVQTYYDINGNQRAALSSTYPIKRDGKIIAVCKFGEDITGMANLSGDEISNEIKQRLIIQKHNFIKEKSRYYTIDSLIGNSNHMQKLKKEIIQASASSSNLFIYGETGTGKEMVAQSIFMLSKDYQKDPFIAQNCAAIPETLMESMLFGTVKGAFTGAESRPGLFESANGGIIYLDEIDSMSINLQSKLLRVIQEGRLSRVGSIKEIPTDFRLISSTSTSPFTLLDKKALRSDLFYRLNVLYIELLPLRKRAEDIPLLIDNFIIKFNQQLNRQIIGFSPAALEKLMKYDWPGNVRELRNVVERAVNKTTKNIIDVDVLVGMRTYLNDRISNTSVTNQMYEENNKVSERISLHYELKRVEQSLIRNVLDRYNGNISKAARELDIPQQTLYNKLKNNGLLEYIKDKYR